MTKVCNPIGNPVPGSDLGISKSNVKPPFVRLESLKWQEIDIDSACGPPVCLSAGAEAGTTNGDVTVPCVNDTADAFGGSQEYKVDFHNLTCQNDFSSSDNPAEALYDVKSYRNDLSVSNSESYTPNGDGYNGPEIIFTFVSEGGVMVNVYDACANGTCECSHVIGGECAHKTNKTCMQWLREIFWICKIYQIRLVPYYINTKNNLVADTLSRLLYIKGESEARKCLNGTGLCCLQKFVDCCRKPGQESGVAS